MPIKLQFSRFGFARLLPHIIELSLVASAALILAWVGWLTWTDLTQWNKSIGNVFFGSRATEAISLGIGMALIHYLLIGVSLLAAGLLLFLRDRIGITPSQVLRLMRFQKANVNQSKNVNCAFEYPVKKENSAARKENLRSGCLHYFGYLSSRPEGSPIPQECLICQRLGDCMVASVYMENFSD